MYFIVSPQVSVAGDIWQGDEVRMWRRLAQRAC
jgi:hypothetical protein